MNQKYVFAVFRQPGQGSTVRLGIAEFYKLFSSMKSADEFLAKRMASSNRSYVYWVKKVRLEDVE